MQRQDFFRYVGQTSPHPDGFEVSRGEGIYLFDVNGQAYVDGISGIAASSFGHNHPQIQKAIISQVGDYMHTMVYGEHIQTPQVSLARKIASYLPETLSNVFFTNGGAEAVEGAIKLSRKFTGRNQIMACKHAYHGSTLAAESLRSDIAHLDAYPPVIDDILHIDFNDVDDLKKITYETAAIFVEPVQGEAGVIEGDPVFMKTLREQCDHTGTLLVFDCIQTGLGRTGQLWGYEDLGVQPDILLLGKALGGGLPLAAFVSSVEIMEVLSTNPILGHMSTYGGNPVCCASGIAAMEIASEPGFLESVNVKGKKIKDILTHHTEKINVEGKGLMLALRLKEPSRLQEYIRACREEKVLLDWFLFNDKSIRLYPPLIITEAECDDLAQRILRAIEKN